MMVSSSALAYIPPEAIRTTDRDSIINTKTDTIRDVSEKTKDDIYRRDGTPGGNFTGKCLNPTPPMPGKKKRGCEVDHRISLQLGGSNAEVNLMLQPYFGPCNADHKDRLETRLHWLIKKNKIGVPEAQELIYNNWEAGYNKFINPKGCR